MARLQCAHPSTRTLGGTGKIIAKEKTAFAAIRIQDLKHPYIRVPGGDAFLLFKANAEKTGRNIETCFNDFFELQIWLEFCFIESKTLGAKLFGIKSPVPWRNLVVATIGHNQPL